jgi:riboflavin biosynthesis pyrimidine reductase
MSVFASLVVGADGATSKDGSSRAISSGVDRTAFLARRRTVDFIFIGGQTARTEPYHRTPVPVVVSSRSMVNALADNRLAHWWNLSPVAAIEKGVKRFGPKVLVESGALMLEYLLSVRMLDGIYLSVTDVNGGDDLVNFEELLQNFLDIDRQKIGDTLFIEAKTLK